MSDTPSEAALRLDGEETCVSERWIDAYPVVEPDRRGCSFVILCNSSAWCSPFGWVSRPRMWAVADRSLGWALLVGVLVVVFDLVPRAPRIKKLRYAVNEHGMEIRQGIFWRKVISIPKQRVQHTDVQQGPIMRRYHICKLVVHTAGTQHATVPLEGNRTRDGPAGSATTSSASMSGSSDGE